jgi:hypothetical protein
MDDRSRVMWARAATVAALLVLVAFAVYVFRTGDQQQRTVRSSAAWAWSLIYEAFPVEDEQELAGLHEDPARSMRTRCVACHGDKLDSELPVHRIHVTSELLADLACPDCHTDVELGVRGATNAPSWVDVGFCVECHSAFPGSLPGSHMCSEDFSKECVECHVDDLAPVHDKPYLPSDIPDSECTGCHGARALPWTSSHESDDWLELHGVEALASGDDECFACHDFGLKFCDDCHAEKPPSHEPSEQWRIDHPDAAQTDTRVCYTCHETTWCKECHVNHEDGWMDNHPLFVEEHGDESCTECHSLSACTFCHTETAVQEGADASTER